MHSCLVIRHGAAEDRAPSGLDADRALTPEGAEQMRAVAVGLAVAERPPAQILCSPYRRARETADAVAVAFGGIPVVEVEALQSGAAAGDMLAALAAAMRGDTGGIALVGHEPDLGRFVSYALAATARSFTSLRKGGACLLEFPATPRAGNATLEWALDPEHLVALGGRPAARSGSSTSATRSR